MAQKFDSFCISLNKLVGQADLEHIQMNEIPRAFFTCIKERDELDFTVYSNLLQVTVRSHAMIYDLDSEPI